MQGGISKFTKMPVCDTRKTEHGVLEQDCSAQQEEAGEEQATNTMDDMMVKTNAT